MMKIIDLNSKVVKNGMWLVVLQIFNMVVPLLTIPYITRVLGTTNYGIFSLALNWVTYIQVIVEYGFAFTGARQVSISSDDNLQKLFSRIITARLILMSFSYVTVNIFGYLLSIDNVSMISLNILFAIVVGVAFQLNWLFQGKQDMKHITIINAIARLVSVVAVFCIVKSSEQTYLYCSCYALTFLISAALSLGLANKKYGLKFRLCSLEDAFGEMKQGWYLFISQAMAKIFSGIGITVLGIFASASIVGVYSAIYKIPFVIILLFSPISQALYPHMSVCFKTSLAFGMKKIINIAKFIIPPFIIAGIIIVIFKEKIISLAFGDEYVYYSVIIIPLMMWVVFSILNNFLGIQILVASGNQQTYSKAFTLSSVVSIFFNISLGFLFGIYGVAIAAPVGEILLAFLLYKKVHNLLNE